MSNQLNTEEAKQRFPNQLDANKRGIYELGEEELEMVSGGGWVGDVTRFLHLDKPINFVADLLRIPRPVRSSSASSSVVPTKHGH